MHQLSQQFCGWSIHYLPRVDAHFLLWMAPLPHTFTRVDDASLHFAFPLPNWSCSLTLMHHSQLLGDPRFTMLRRSSLLIFWDSQLTSDHLT